MTDIQKMAEKAVVGVEYLRTGAVTTICRLTLDNGFEVIGTSACANPDDFDGQVGRDCARETAMESVYTLMAFRIKEETAAGTAKREEVLPPGELPLYQCHKLVRAEKIRTIGREAGSSVYTLHFGIAAVTVSEAWANKHGPEEGGYYVVYPDGYTSYSPASAFESGYARVGE